uniref:Uncharacterized protein n=1 Tax=Rhizophora mucronata TaxID=61149 RepID=A0A2P2QLR8_RHIMU
MNKATHPNDTNFRHPLKSSISKSIIKQGKQLCNTITTFESHDIYLQLDGRVYQGNDRLFALLPSQNTLQIICTKFATTTYMLTPLP